MHLLIINLDLPKLTYIILFFIEVWLLIQLGRYQYVNLKISKLSFSYPFLWVIIFYPLFFYPSLITILLIFSCRIIENLRVNCWIHAFIRNFLSIFFFNLASLLLLSAINFFLFHFLICPYLVQISILYLFAVSLIFSFGFKLVRVKTLICLLFKFPKNSFKPI